MSATNVAFGQRLRELRHERGVSQETLARMTGVNRTSVWTCENGGSDPRLSTILRLARGLDVTPGVLLDPLVRGR
jgi:transcriptional regulator with XRE-family HTH domain